MLGIRVHFNIEAECSKCELTTNFEGSYYFRTNERKFVHCQYQCQGCGQLSYSNEFQENDVTVGIKDPCECGGQHRSNMNIFCPGCHHRKDETNKSESYLTISEEDFKKNSKLTRQIITQKNHSDLTTKFNFKTKKNYFHEKNQYPKSMQSLLDLTL